jgi:hypothetical protein
MKNFFATKTIPDARSCNLSCNQCLGSEILVNIYCVERLLFKGGYTLVTLPRIVTPYRDSVDENRERVTYQKLVTR